MTDIDLEREISLLEQQRVRLIEIRNTTQEQLNQIFRNIERVEGTIGFLRNKLNQEITKKKQQEKEMPPMRKTIGKKSIEKRRKEIMAELPKEAKEEIEKAIKEADNLKKKIEPKLN